MPRADFTLDDVRLESVGVQLGPAIITAKSNAVPMQEFQSVCVRLEARANDGEVSVQPVPARPLQSKLKAGSLPVIDELSNVPGSLRTMFRSLARAQELDCGSRIAYPCVTHAADAAGAGSSLPVCAVWPALVAGHVCRGCASREGLPRWSGLSTARTRGGPPVDAANRSRSGGRVEHREQCGPDEGRWRLINDPARFEGERVIDLDEHVRRPTRRGDKYVPVIINRTPVADGMRPSRLLDMMPGRSKTVFKTGLSEGHRACSSGIEPVATDGSSGFKTASTEELPTAIAVRAPFLVVCLAGDALDNCRRRVQQRLHGHRGRPGAPLYSCRRTLHIRIRLLTDRRRARVRSLLDHPDEHVDAEVTWAAYQRLIGTYRDPDGKAGKTVLAAMIALLRTGVPTGLAELRKLRPTLNERAADILAYFDRPGTSNGPREANIGRLDHLRGTALGFQNLEHYTA